MRNFVRCVPSVTRQIQHKQQTEISPTSVSHLCVLFVDVGARIFPFQIRLARESGFRIDQCSSVRTTRKVLIRFAFYLLKVFDNTRSDCSCAIASHLRSKIHVHTYHTDIVLIRNHFFDSCPENRGVYVNCELSRRAEFKNCINCNSLASEYDIFRFPFSCFVEQIEKQQSETIGREKGSIVCGKRLLLPV